MDSSIKINKLVIKGPGRDYEVKFYDGVNIIAGPIFTGKSSILELIDYALGAKAPPMYPELSKCSEIYLEIEICLEVITIRRSLKAHTAAIHIYIGTIKEVFANTIIGKEVAFRHTSNKDSISSELLSRLGISNLKVKNAPTQEASQLSAFSFRDLLTLLYIEQDRMGSKKNGFFESVFFKFTKWKAAFEISLNIFDEDISSISKSLNDAIAKKNEIESYLKNNQDFLDKFQIPNIDELRGQLKAITIQEESLLNKIKNTNNESHLKLGNNYELVGTRNTLSSKSKLLQSQIAEYKRSLIQLGKLMVQYSKEKQQFDFLQESEKLVGSLPVVRCPSCFQSIDDEDKIDVDTCLICKKKLPQNTEDISVERRSRSLKAKMKDLSNYINQLEESQIDIENQFKTIRLEIEKIDSKLKIIEETTLLPTSRHLLELHERLGLIQEEKRKINSNIDFRNKSVGEGSELTTINYRIRSLEGKLKKRKLEATSPGDIITIISNLFVGLLNKVKFPATENAFIDLDSYLPQVRGQSYKQLKSMGAISLIQVCWHLSLLNYSLKNTVSFPKFLVFDSPLSHLGKGADDTEFKDQQIIDSFYETIEEFHEEHGDDFQLIMIDNYPPSRMEYLVNIQFTRDPKIGRFGLIDDEHSPHSEG